MRGAPAPGRRAPAAPGKGSRIASRNTSSISPITTTLATDRWMNSQSTVCAGWLRLKTADANTLMLFPLGVGRCAKPYV